MLRSKKEVPGFRTLVSKIWSHIKYRSRGYGTPDYEEGFLGIGTMGWMNFQSKIHRIVDTCKWKYRAVKERIKTLIACSQFWKLPKVIEQFQDATYEAEREIRSLADDINNHTDRFDDLLEDLIERMDLGSLNVDNWCNRKMPTGTWKTTKHSEWIKKYQGSKWLDESHEDYENDIENIRSLYEQWDIRIPSNFLTEAEAEDQMWKDCDNRYDYHFDAVDDFDYFRIQIDKSFYNKSKVWDEELFPKLEKEKKDREEAEARLNDQIS